MGDVEGDLFRVSVAGLPKLKLFSDAKVGEKLEGRVAKKTKAGVYVDVGYDKLGWVLAPRSEALEKLEANQSVSATVEKVDVEGFRVSVAGLPKLKLFSDLKVGEMVDGKVSARNSAGFLVDIGCEQLALLAGKKETSALEPNDELKGMKVEEVDVEKAQAVVSFAGL